MRRFIAKNIGFPLQDSITHTKIVKTKRFLKESQYWDDTKIYEFQLNKFKSIVKYSFENIRYYNSSFK